MSTQMRATMGDAAIEAARAVGYVGAGTAEFIADASNGLRPDRFWFMEMNTRLQVEHPVTEAICGVDLVEWQFRVASGEGLPLQQAQVQINGHAIEARVYAEDPERGFLPSTGRILALELPQAGGIRVDTGVETGSEVSPFYDAMVAKVIAHAASRSAAIEKLSAALDHTLVVGPRSNVAFLSALLHAAEFRAAKFDTGLIDRNLAKLGAVPHGIDRAAAAEGASRLLTRELMRTRRPQVDDEAPRSPWDAVDGFQLSAPRIVSLPILVDGEAILAATSYGERGVAVEIEGVVPTGDARVVETEDAVYVLRQGRETIVRLTDFEAVDVVHFHAGGTITSPMHGKVLDVLVKVGESVRKGQRIALVEAMKMEHAVLAPRDGVVAEVAVAAGDQIAEKAKIAVIDPSEKQ
jgi:3-methylcrotonyl-CoA carboxylase alpha subunit